MKNINLKTLPLVVASTILLLSTSCKKDDTEVDPTPNDLFITGADISYTNKIEASGGVWKDTDGNNIDLYDYFVERVAKLLRVRLFHTPENITDHCGNPITANNLTDVLNASLRIKNAGADLMVTLHYGDYFNYPSEQPRPLVWDGLSHAVLLDSIYNYTYMVLEKLYNQNTVPTIISIGNESTWGFVDAYAPYESGTETNGWEWPQDAEKFNIAFNAVDDFNTDYNQSVKKTVHLIDETVESNMEDFTANGVTNFDIIGYSFYPGFAPSVSIADIGNQVKRLREDYPDKEVMILETGWQWTEDAGDSYGNFLDLSNVINYPLTEHGQYDYLMALKNTLKANGASGLLYWQPEWISSTMCDMWGQGSSYEDASFFDFNNGNRALKAFDFLKD